MTTPDRYAWHVASGATHRRNHPWFVCRDLPRPNDRGVRVEYLENKNGKLRTFHIDNYDYAQREADKLNANEHNWTNAELEAVLQQNLDNVSVSFLERIIKSHIRANHAVNLMSALLAEEAEEGYDPSKFRRVE